MRRLVLSIALTVAMSCLGVAPGGAAANDKVRIIINPTVLGQLAVFVAIEKGYFAQQNIDLDVKTTTQPTISTLPQLVRGDLDMVPLSLAPAFFNQASAGFNVKIVSSIQSAHPGYNDGVMLLVRQDVWDAGTIRKPSDLKGHVVDGLAPGTLTDLLMRETLAAGHLTPADVTYNSRYRGVADIEAGLHNKAVEVVSGFEPSATAFQEQKLAHKWISSDDVMPWFQGSFWAASAPFIAGHPDIVKRMLVAYLQGARYVNRTNGKWSPELLAIAAKYSGLPIATLAQISGPSWADPSGIISTNSLNRQEQAFITDGLVTQPVAVSDLIDEGPLLQARQALAPSGRR